MCCRSVCPSSSSSSCRPEGLADPDHGKVARLVLPRLQQGLHEVLPELRPHRHQSDLRQGRCYRPPCAADLSALRLVQAVADPKDWLTRIMERSLGWFFRGFNKVFTKSSQNYGPTVTKVIYGKAVVIGLHVLPICLPFV